MASDNFLASCQQLRSIKPGWYEGNTGKAIVPAFIDTCENVVTQLVRRNDVEEPRLYPVEDGSIDLVWERKGLHCTMDVEGNALIVCKKEPFASKWGDILVQDYLMPDKQAERNDFVYRTLLSYLSPGSIGGAQGVPAKLK
jgi:hypothetical protein